MVSLQWQRWADVLNSCLQRKSSGRFRKEWSHSAAVHQQEVPAAHVLECGSGFPLSAQSWQQEDRAVQRCRITGEKTFLVSGRLGTVQIRKRKKVNDFTEDGPCICFSLLSWVESVLFVLRGLLFTCSGNCSAFQETGMEQARFSCSEMGRIDFCVWVKQQQQVFT